MSYFQFLNFLLMQIIQATAAHLDQLAPLFDGYRVFYKQAPNLHAARNFLQSRFESNDSVIFIAMNDEGKGLGFTQLYPLFSSVSMQRTYVLNDLFVTEQGRGAGVGAALMKQAQHFASESGSKGLTLETAVNNPAQHLYRKLGWVQDREVNHYTWEV